ncbi:hypothetical protein T05_13684 [Trichinella murrelli]|uniref:Uncharacterized protein n=1 Tax=Trichinella murrelli TaxID=144512 RepID=A0A0V0TI76_9BILA|nr:hypothetical protein T05_13684 [Trichinella murrelli]
MQFEKLNKLSACSTATDRFCTIGALVALFQKVQILICSVVYVYCSAEVFNGTTFLFHFNGPNQSVSQFGWLAVQ